MQINRLALSIRANDATTGPTPREDGGSGGSEGAAYAGSRGLESHCAKTQDWP